MDKAQFLARAKSLRRVEVKELGEGVYLQSLTWAQQHEYEILVANLPADDKKNATLLLVAATLVNENGQRLFQFGEIDELREIDSKLLLRLVLEAQKLVDLSDEDIAELKKRSKKDPS